MRLQRNSFTGAPSVVVAVVAGGAAVVALGVLYESDESGDARGQQVGNRDRHHLLALEHEADLPELDDRRLGAGELARRGTRAENGAARDLPGGHAAVAGDRREAHLDDVGQRVAGRPPEDRHADRGAHQLTLSVHDDERLVVRRGRDRARDSRDHAAGDGGGGQRLATRVLGEAEEECEQDRSVDEHRRDELEHGNLVLGKEALVTARG